MFMISRLALPLILASISPQSASADEACKEIRFQKGKISTIVKGTAPAEGIACYILGVRKGQMVMLRVAEGAGSIAFNRSPDGRDVQRNDNFKAEANSYRIDVFQYLRAVEDEPFGLEVLVR